MTIFMALILIRPKEYTVTVEMVVEKSGEEKESFIVHTCDKGTLEDLENVMDHLGIIEGDALGYAKALGYIIRMGLLTTRLDLKRGKLESESKNQKRA